MNYSGYRQVDTTVGIWDIKYLCKIPLISTRSIDDIEKYGSYTTLDKNIDNMVMSELTTTYINIDRMVELYREGVCIRLVDSNDIVKIYNAIQDHILAWSERIDRAVNIGDIPLDDLVLMDRFASEIYVNAKHYFTEERMQSYLEKGLIDIVGIFTPSRFYNAKKQKELKLIKQETDGVYTITSDGEKNFHPERESLSDRFIQFGSRIGRL